MNSRTFIQVIATVFGLLALLLFFAGIFLLVFQTRHAAYNCLRAAGISFCGLMLVCWLFEELLTNTPKAIILWSSVAPTESGDYWHWYGDPEVAPFHYTVQFSGTAQRYFVHLPWIGAYENHSTEWVDAMGGYWAPSIPPNYEEALPNEEESDS